MVSEVPEHYDIEIIHRKKWRGMTFNAFELGIIGTVENAFNVLGEDGVIVENIHEVPWSKCCATVID